MTLPAAVALAAGLAAVGRVLGWLTTEGTIAAALVGAAVFAGGGFSGAALLALFFVSGSVLTALADRSRRPLDSSRAKRRKGRTARQVLANGLWPATGAVVLGSGHGAGWPLLLGSLAAAQADTWATEIGARATTPPRLITSGQYVAAGTSGGVSLLGTTGAFLGAAAMGILGWALGSGAFVAVSALFAGVAGMLADSFLGAAVQAVFYCETCSKETEWRVHRCGRRSQPVRGWRWIDNDTVNFAGTAVGGLSAIALWMWW